jgi:hypothetical protein
MDGVTKHHPIHKWYPQRGYQVGFARTSQSLRWLLDFIRRLGNPAH